VAPQDQLSGGDSQIPALDTVDERGMAVAHAGGMARSMRAQRQWRTMVLLACPLFSACAGEVPNESEDVASATEPQYVLGTGNMGYEYCGQERVGQTCALSNFGQSKLVAFVHGTIVYRDFQYGSLDCTREAFGLPPPLPGEARSGGCYFANYAYLASEDAPATVSKHEVAFGAQGHFSFRYLDGSFTCNRSTFGGDPLPGVPKACFVPLVEYSRVASLAGVEFPGDQSTFKVYSPNTPVAFGQAGNFQYRLFGAGTYSCERATFHPADPNLIVGDCYKFPTPYAADENTGFTAQPGPFYGSGLNGNWLLLQSIAAESIQCSNSTFDGDPHPGVFKHCYSR
jgi:hypothetical protein